MFGKYPPPSQTTQCVAIRILWHPPPVYWTARIIGRSQWLLYKCSSPWQKLWKAKALIGYSVSTYSVVCLCVCPQATGHSFWPRNLMFWHDTPWDMRKKLIFFVFRNFDFWPFEGPFSAIFEYFLLYPLYMFCTCYKSHLSTFKLDFWHRESLWHHYVGF